MTLCTRYSATAWVVVTALLATGFATHAEDGFKMLDEKDIRSRIVGKDITEGPHWSMYLRSDGALISSESGSSRTGSWKIRNNKLCMAHQSGETFNCDEVWMSGANIRLRENKDQEIFDSIVARHQAN